MTDQIPADKVREIIAGMRESMRRAECDGTSPKFMGSMLVYVAALEALLPPPPRPTLADMTEEERAACQWMQADHPEYGRVIVLRVDDDGDPDAYRVLVLEESGEVARPAGSRVTPRPDLPRMEWPGTEKPAPAPVAALPDGWRLAEHRKYGRVIVTTQTPNSNGYVYVVIPDAGNFTGYDWRFCEPNRLTYLDTEPEADQ